MKLHLLFIGNKFIYNKPLQAYIVRKVEEKCNFISSISYYKDGDNSLLLSLEEELQTDNKIIIITSKNNFSTIGKLIATITGDNQVLKEKILLPSKVELYEKDTYLLEYRNSTINVLSMQEMKMMPEILLKTQTNKASVNLFNEDKDTALALLNPIAQTNDVSIEVIEIIDDWLLINVQSNKYGNISNFIKSAKQLFSKKLIESANVIEHLIKRLSQNEKKVSFAESCTGGLLSYYFTSVNGASQVLDGSLITYSNDLKDNWLAVENNVLQEYGAVSSEVVRQMSDGAMNVSHADYTLAISGIAGDSGGSIEKPIGTVYIGVRSQTEHEEVHLTLNGDRNYIQHQSALHAIKMLLLIDKKIFF